MAKCKRQLADGMERGRKFRGRGSVGVGGAGLVYEYKSPSDRGVICRRFLEDLQPAQAAVWSTELVLN